jgi:hypothetical protein
MSACSERGFCEQAGWLERLKRSWFMFRCLNRIQTEPQMGCCEVASPHTGLLQPDSSLLWLQVFPCHHREEQLVSGQRISVLPLAYGGIPPSFGAYLPSTWPEVEPGVSQEIQTGDWEGGRASPGTQEGLVVPGCKSGRGTEPRGEDREMQFRKKFQNTKRWQSVA